MLRLAAIGIPLLPLVAAYEWYDINNQPTSPWQKGQIGHNACGTTDSPDSMCQTVMINSVEDFCLWAPPNPNSEIGETEAEEVAWCTASGHGARLMPQGTITSAHMLVTPHYTQITGTGDFTKLNVRAGDSGGELDPHGADGTGNPRGGLVYHNGQQVQEWNSFISDTEFCIRVCPTSDPDSWQWCQHIYDTEGCGWNSPSNNNQMSFDTCDGDGTDLPPGIYSNGNGGLSTYYHENGAAPTPHAAGASSNCQAVATVGGQGAANAYVSSESAPTTSSSAYSSSASSAASSSASSSVSSSDSSLSTSTVSSSASSSMITSVSSSTVSSTASSSSVSSTISTATVISSASGVRSTSTISNAPASSSSSSPSPARQAAASSSRPSSSAAQVVGGIASFAFAVFGGVALLA
ncbi:hypothetical protein JCM11491_000803 [Sporobolomyces phaffii]